MWLQPPGRKRPFTYGQDFLGGAQLPPEDQNALATYILNSTYNTPAPTGSTQPAPENEPQEGPPGGAPPPQEEQTDQPPNNPYEALPRQLSDYTPQGLWDAMNAIDEGWHPGANTWVDQYRQLLIDQVIPYALERFGPDQIQNVLGGIWPQTAMNWAREEAIRRSGGAH